MCDALVGHRHVVSADTEWKCPAVIGDYPLPRRDEEGTLTYEFGSSLSPLVAAWVLDER